MNVIFRPTGMLHRLAEQDEDERVWWTVCRQRCIRSGEKRSGKGLSRCVGCFA